jgi:hypothetical protein
MVVAAASGTSIASAKGGQPLPANAKFRGKTLEQWSFLQSQWLIATELGGQSLPDTIKNTRFLPGPFSPGTHQFDVVVPPGTGLVSPPFFAFGELYENGTSDNPDDLAPIIDIIFNETQLDVSLDGDLLLSGTPAELGQYAYGFTDPLFFDEPIFYEVPIDRGGILAVAAVWTLGVGAVYHPLPPGEHTLRVLQDGPIFGSFDATYNISVRPPGASAVPEPACILLLGIGGFGLVGRGRWRRPVTG